MARFDKSRPKGQKPDAAVAASRPKRSQTMAPAIEDTMFFPRLRRHAKWMFVFLALVFGLGFVLFGVGAGGVGVGDVFRDSGGSEAQSITDARKETEANPKSVAAWRALATALQTEGETDEAVAALVRVTELAPTDPDAFRELGGVYLTQVTEKQRAVQIAQGTAAYRGAGQNLPGRFTVKSVTVVEDPIGRSVNAVAAVEVERLSTIAIAAARGAVNAYTTVAELQPDDPNVQIELAQAAETAGDAATAIAAYERFIELAPDDPTTVSVKDRLKQLTATPSG
jgi:tetratricopeptide (TPR) repeat protein